MTHFLILSMLVFSTSGAATSMPVPPPCCPTPGSAVQAYFSRVSGPPGKRDWSAVRELILPNARFNAVGITEAGENAFHPQSAEDYLRHVGEYVRSKGFYQYEICRSEHTYARMASVLSVYASRNSPSGPVIDRGVIAFHLVKDKGRWFIASALWNSETKASPLTEAQYPPGCRGGGKP